jgi:hypothetical protein
VQAQRDSCFIGLAEEQKNASLCGKVNRTSSQFSLCMLNVSINTGNESYCLQLNGEDRSSCTMSLAKIGGFSNLSMCNSIGNASERNECVDMYQYNSALKSGAASDCKKLPGTANMTVLSLMLADSVLNSTAMDTQGALLATLNASPRSYCYFSLATHFGNSTLCAQTTGLLDQACLAMISSSGSTTNITNVTSFCSSLKHNFSSNLPMPSGNYSALCMRYVLTDEALSTKNISKCLEITGAQSVYSCITGYATKYLNASYCAYITNSSAQQDCYTTVTLKKNQTV